MDDGHFLSVVICKALVRVDNLDVFLDAEDADHAAFGQQELFLVAVD